MSDYPDPWGPGGKFMDDGLQPVDEEDDGCAPDCPYCNGTGNVSACFCGPSCEGNRGTRNREN